MTSCAITQVQKAAILLLVLKEIIRAAPCFFLRVLCVVCWHGTSKQHFRSKNFAPRTAELAWSCSLLSDCDCKRQSSNSRGKFHLHP
jgi:hypothetical protein